MVKDINLDERFWDCECETRYIHHKNHLACNECFARQYEQPDSREDEIMEVNMAPNNKGIFNLNELD